MLKTRSDFEIFITEYIGLFSVIRKLESSETLIEFTSDQNCLYVDDMADMMKAIRMTNTDAYEYILKKCTDD